MAWQYQLNHCLALPLLGKQQYGKNNACKLYEKGCISECIFELNEDKIAISNAFYGVCGLNEIIEPYDGIVTGSTQNI